MIHHIVLFQFKPGISDAAISELAKGLNRLKGQFSGVVRYVWGPSASIEHLEKGYTHGFVMTFRTAKDRDNYVSHPLHKQLIHDLVDPICQTGLVFDIEE